MGIEVGVRIENGDDPGLVAELVENERHEIGARAAFHMDGRDGRVLGMGDHAGGKGGGAAVVGPEGLIDLVHAVVVDETAHRIKPPMEIRDRLEIEQRDDLLHLGLRHPRCLPAADGVDGEPCRGQAGEQSHSGEDHSPGVDVSFRHWPSDGPRRP